MIADYGYWSRTQTSPYSSALITFRRLTHISHAGVSFGAKGNLKVTDGFLEPQLIAGAHAAGVKVLLLLGGDFAGLETNTTTMPNLIRKLQSFITQNGYDGVDINWEYPASELDQQTFHALMQALRSAFPEPRYVISADVAPWGGTGYDFPDVTPLVDYFNIMTYDCGSLDGPRAIEFGHFSRSDESRAIRLRAWGERGRGDRYLSRPVEHIPAAKFNIGTPFY